MQKKLLALVASVAMVLSMFTGVAFATGGDAPEYEVILNTPAIMSTGDALTLQKVNGSLIDKNDGTLYAEAVKVVVEEEKAEADKTLYEGEFDNGSFVAYVPTNIPAQNLVVKVVTTGTEPVELATAQLPVKYNVSLDNPLEYDYDANKAPVIVMGKVTDKNGKAVKDAKVDLKLGTESCFAAVAETDENGVFGQIATFEAAGELKLYVNGVEHLTGEVAALGMNLTVTPNTGIVHTIAPTHMTFKISGGPAGEAVTINIYDADDNEAAGFTAVADALDENGALELEDKKWEPTAAGTYTVEAKAGNTHVATATVQVVNPATYNLMGVHALESMKIGTETLTFNEDNIHLVRYSAKGIDEDADFKYVVYVDGEVALDQTKEAGEVETTVELKADELGSKVIRILAYEGATKVYDQSFTMVVTGWDVTCDTEELVADQVQDITLVVKDEEGVPVNNATVKVDGTVKISPATHNISSGTYVLEEVTAAAGSAPVVISVHNAQDGAEEATVTLNVVGEKVYDVTADTPALLLGEQTVRLVVTENGQAFIPANLKVQVGDAAAAPQAFKPVDSDKDGVYDAIDVTYTATSTEEPVTFRAENHDGSQCGEVVLEVKAPQLEVIENSFLTENFNTKVVFRVVNPIDGSVITDNVTLEPKNVKIAVTDANGGVSGETLLGAEEHTVNILAKDAEWEEAADAEEEVEVALKIGKYDVEGSFLVKEATLTSDPEAVVIGQANPLTLTYADANGLPIVGQEVYVLGGVNPTLVGETDEAGQVTYAAAGAVAFQATTAVDEKYVLANVKGIVDTEAPIIDELPTTVDNDKLTITVTDNVKVTRLVINNEEIVIVPQATVTHTLQLQEGANDIRIVALDAFGNGVEKTFTVNYQKPAPVEAGIRFVVGKSNYTNLANGEQAQMVAAYKQGNHTMVAVRMLQDLGAKFAWNQATRTATFTLNDKVVQVTQDSTTATVNGQAVKVPVAPRNLNGRIMVPVRFISENLGLFVHWQPGDIITIK